MCIQFFEWGAYFILKEMHFQDPFGEKIALAIGLKKFWPPYCPTNFPFFW